MTRDLAAEKRDAEDGVLALIVDIHAGRRSIRDPDTVQELHDRAEHLHKKVEQEPQHENTA